MKVNRNVSVSGRFICKIFLSVYKNAQWKLFTISIVYNGNFHCMCKKCAVEIVSFLIEDSIIRTIIQKFNFAINHRDRNGRMKARPVLMINSSNEAFSSHDGTELIGLGHQAVRGRISIIA